MRWPSRRHSKEDELEDEILAHLAIEAKQKVEEASHRTRRRIRLAGNSATSESSRRLRAACGGTAGWNL